MSKASEWAKQAQGFEMDTDIRFVVSHSGGMNLVALGHFTNCYTPQQALALARWILDTFSEPEAPP